MTVASPAGHSSTNGPRLRRSLSLWDLLVYGVIIVCPISPAPFYGILTQRGHGHAATTILIAMFAMLPTAISYGRTGASLRKRRIRLYLRGSGNRCSRWVYYRLGHDDGLSP